METESSVGSNLKPEEPTTRRKLIRIVGRIVFSLVQSLALLWCTAAIAFDGPRNRFLSLLCVIALVLVSVFFLYQIRPFRRAALASSGLILAVILWWLTINPSNNRDWQPDVAQLTTAEFEGDHVTLTNVRNFNYRAAADYDEAWETRTYDLSQVRAFDMFISYWGPRHIAHTIASWEFADGRHLAISIETRKEKGETYSALRGFFRQFELYYVVADERDVIGLRAGHRGEQVYLYRLKHSPEVAESLLRDYLVTLNRLAEDPEWYNALTDNCTTSIRHHAQAIGAANKWNWRIWVNGHLDEMGYELGLVDTSIPLEELRSRSDITSIAKLALTSSDFSKALRSKP